MTKCELQIALVAVTAGLLTACANGPPKMSSDVAAVAAPLSTAITEIRDKSIDPPEVDRLFTGALTGLSAIDHNLRFEPAAGSLAVRHGEMIVAQTPRPGAQDIDVWINDIQTLLTAARATSKPLAAASSEALLQAMFDGFMPLLDPYSKYAGKNEAAHNRSARNGFVGLGVDLQQVSAGAVVVSTLKDGPATAAGVTAGDIITHVDGTRLSGLALPAILKRFDGSVDSVATLAIDRAGVAHTFAVRRALIIPDTVKTETRNGVLHLTISSFNARTTISISEAAATAGPLHGVILDLRGDPGGLLDQAVGVADLFLDGGVITNLRGRHPGATQSYAATPGDIFGRLPVAILMDGVSASASEILAAALQENKRAIVVGTSSVGKGTVQTLVPLPNGGELALTWARVFTPNGALLNDRGVLPDICTTAPTIGPQASVGAIIAAAVRMHAAKPPTTPSDIKAARIACRPEPHINDPTDVEVAEHWLADTGLQTALAANRVRKSHKAH